VDLLRQTLQVFATDPQLEDADGLAFGSEDGNLYVNTYEAGRLVKIEVHGPTAGKVTTLKMSLALKHPDGMRSIAGNTFMLVDGAATLDRITVHGDSASVDILRDGLLEPSAVAQVGQIAWVAQGQIGLLFDSKSEKKPQVPFKPIAVTLPTPAESAAGRPPTNDEHGTPGSSEGM
jgi:sugar lactone lactonase YvrE